VSATDGGVWTTAILGVVQIVIALINRSTRNSQHAEIAASVEVVRQDVNGKMSQMLDAREAKGNLQRHADEKENPT